MNLMKFKFELPKANAELKKVLLPQNMKIVTPDLCKTKSANDWISYWNKLITVYPDCGTGNIFPTTAHLKVSSTYVSVLYGTTTMGTAYTESDRTHSPVAMYIPLPRIPKHVELSYTFIDNTSGCGNFSLFITDCNKSVIYTIYSIYHDTGGRRKYVYNKKGNFHGATGTRTDIKSHTLTITNNVFTDTERLRPCFLRVVSANSFKLSSTTVNERWHAAIQNLVLRFETKV